MPVPIERQKDYVYVLGMYLGDGHIASQPRTFRLSVYLDPAHPDIIGRCAAAMASANPFHPVSILKRQHVTLVRSHGICWPVLLPQHRPGHKYERTIALEAWQTTIVEAHPASFLRGLIESDGCRFERIVDGKAYPAYEFTNKSGDILGLFEWTCTLLGVHFTRPSAVDVSIARRADVALLDTLIGPKS